MWPGTECFQTRRRTKASWRKGRNTCQSHVCTSPHCTRCSFSILKRFSSKETCQNNRVSAHMPNLIKHMLKVFKLATIVLSRWDSYCTSTHRSPLGSFHCSTERFLLFACFLGGGFKVCFRLFHFHKKQNPVRLWTWLWLLIWVERSFFFNIAQISILTVDDWFFSFYILF